MLQAVQLGMNTADMAGSIRLYSEAFGFENGGAQAIWGETIKIQGLPSTARAVMWWLVGRQGFFQLEFFHHSSPAQRPLRADWQASDCGWSRIGVVPADFDRSLKVLQHENIALIGSTTGAEPNRRAVFRDPYVGMVVELLEDCVRCGPRIAYAASVVTDLESARRYYGWALGLTIRPLESLHDATDQGRWALPDAKCTGFSADAGTFPLEIISYSDGISRQRATDYRVSDQGVANVALGSRSQSQVREALTRIEAMGHRAPHVIEGQGIVAAYIIDPEREIELLALPEELDEDLGFVAKAPFLG